VLNGGWLCSCSWKSSEFLFLRRSFVFLQQLDVWDDDAQLQCRPLRARRKLQGHYFRSFRRFLRSATVRSRLYLLYYSALNQQLFVITRLWAVRCFRMAMHVGAYPFRLHCYVNHKMRAGLSLPMCRGVCACLSVCWPRLWAVLKWMNRSRCRVDKLWCPGPSLDTTYNSLAAVEPSTLLLCDSDNNVTYCNCTLRRTYKISSFLSYSSVNKSLQHWQQNLALLLPHVEQLW